MKQTTNKDDNKLIGIVQKEMKGDATEEELQLLHGDAKRWKDILNIMLRDLNNQFTERRSMAANSSPDAQKQYTIWKKGAAQYKTIIETKLTKVKTVLNSRNIEENYDKLTINNQILAELKSIKNILESNLK